MPTGVLEAMSYGLPCIISRECNIPEDAETSGACRFVDLSVDSITRSLYNLLNNEKDRELLSKHGRQYAIRNFDYKNITKQYIRSYKHVLEMKNKDTQNAEMQNLS